MFEAKVFAQLLSADRRQRISQSRLSQLRIGDSVVMLAEEILDQLRQRNPAGLRLCKQFRYDFPSECRG